MKKRSAMTDMARRLALATMLAALSSSLCMSSAVAAQRVDVGSDTKSEGITVRASAELQADPRTVLSVITDYDH
ncbi:MAG: hypothetical protein JSS14_30250, partial [Proteobacteria bacterium]|nr:hypothetical protein [Pseudomonadota bacterium]